jgi:tetratricopeptide (TPR) repeat protein
MPLASRPGHLVSMIGMLCALLSMGGIAMGKDATERDELPAFDKLWNFQKPDETEQRFRELLPRAKASGNKDYHGQLLTQIARTRGLQRDFDGAHKLLDEAKGVLDHTCPLGQVRLWLERGRVFNSSKQKDKAYPFFLRAFVQANRIEADLYTVDAVHMLAIIAEPDDAVQWNELAIDLAERAKDPRAKRWLGSLYNNIGWSFHDRKDYEKALGYWEKALTWHLEFGKTHTQRIAKWAVGRGLRSLGRHEGALRKQQALLAEYVASGDEEAGYTREEIGENLWALGRKDEARPFFAGAHERMVKDEWLVANEKDRLDRLARLAKGGEE